MHRETLPAEFANIPGIMAVLEENLIANKKGASGLEKTGFLIHPFTTEELKKSIEDKINHITLISIEDDEVIGYAMGCNIKQLKPHSQEKLAGASPELANSMFSEKVFYYRHIAKKTNKRQVGKRLLASLLEMAKQQNYHSVICQIAQHPLKNIASIAFHSKFGFKYVGKIQDGDYILGIYLKSLK